MNMSRFEGGLPPERLTTIPDAIQKNLEDCVQAFVRMRNGSGFLTENPATHSVAYHIGKFTPDHPLRALLKKKLAREGLTIADLEQAHQQQVKEWATFNQILAEEPKKTHYKKVADALMARKKAFETFFLQMVYKATAADSAVKNAVLIAKNLPDHPFSQWLKTTFLDLLSVPDDLDRFEKTLHAHHKVEADIESALAPGSDTRTYLTEQKERDAQARVDTLNAVRSLINVFLDQKIIPADDKLLALARERGLAATEFAIALAKSPYERDQAIEAMGAINKEHVPAIYDELSRKFDKKNPTVADYVKKLNEDLRIYKKVLLQAGFSADSFPFEQLVPAWIDAHYAYDESSEAIESYTTEIKGNIETMIALETAEPGACVALNKEFGVKTFGRYPTKMLIEQYRQRNKDIPYGLVIYPRADHNGAFYQDAGLFKKMLTDTRAIGVGIRVMEVDHAVDLPLALIATNARYGYTPTDDEKKKTAKHLLSFAILGGHGSPYNVTLGRPELGRGSAITTGDIGGSDIAVAKNFFEDGATGVLFSCKTGQGFTPLLSVRLDMPFIGPAHNSHPTSVEVKKHPNKKGLKLLPTYEDESKKPVAAVGIEQLTTD